MNKLKRYFLSGLIIFLPLAITVKILVVTFGFADGILGKYLQPFFSREFGFYIRGIGILICLLLILFIGFLATNFLGKKIYEAIERLLMRLPFFKQLYPAFKEISMFLFSREKMTFSQVVLVEYPRKGMYSIGFLTNEVGAKISEKTGHEMYYVFIPHTPSPLTGFLTLVPKPEVSMLDITVEEAIRILVSAGVVK